MVTLEKVEISQEPSTEDKEESLESEQNVPQASGGPPVQETPETELVPRASDPEIEKPAGPPAQGTPKKRGRPRKEAAPPAEPKKRGRPPLPPKELPERVPSSPVVLRPGGSASLPPIMDEATLNQYLLKALMDHKRTSVLRREEHWRGLVKF